MNDDLDGDVEQARRQARAVERLRRQRPYAVCEPVQRLCSERDINLSAWLRRLVVRELDRELGPQGDTPEPGPEREPGRPTPLRRWSPYKLEDGSWGACYLGDTGKLPEDLVGHSIQITTRRGDSWTATALEVLQHETDSVVVQDSGKPPENV